MIRPADKMTLSNTKVISSIKLSDNRTLDEFDITPPMSTYLVAFIVSNYDGISNNDTAKPFGVYARPHAKEQTKLALEFGQQMLAQLGVYLGIDYYSVNRVTKMDMAAIPDFSAGAMEVTLLLF
jgi:aminopeptidase N